MEIHLEDQLRSLNLVQVIIFYKLKLTIVSTILQITQPEVLGSISSKYPILRKMRGPFGGLSPCFLVNMLAKEVY